MTNQEVGVYLLLLMFICMTAAFLLQRHINSNSSKTTDSMKLLKKSVEIVNSSVIADEKPLGFLGGFPKKTMKYTFLREETEISVSLSDFDWLAYGKCTFANVTFSIPGRQTVKIRQMLTADGWPHEYTDVAIGAFANASMKMDRGVINEIASIIGKDIVGIERQLKGCK